MSSFDRDHADYEIFTCTASFSSNERKSISPSSKKIVFNAADFARRNNSTFRRLILLVT